jgi:signal peptidase II
MLEGHPMKRWIPKIVSPEIAFFVLLVGLDQLTKWWAYLSFINWTIIPDFFYFSYTRNTGAAWSILEGQLPLLALISFIAGSTMFVYYWIKGYTMTNYFRWLLIVIMAGTWGNFIDRAFYQEGVIDFISFQFGSYFFPTFNLADAYLTIGVIILIGVTLLEEYVWKKNPLKLK